jgi:hypothetical protein
VAVAQGLGGEDVIAPRGRRVSPGAGLDRAALIVRCEAVRPDESRDEGDVFSTTSSGNMPPSARLPRS